ncbi:MAG: threonine--tRNA ligase [Alphaproteobacteria bacterium]|nr:threonine--tRNA ligase [Alphaproteobacteria bacterium]
MKDLIPVEIQRHSSAHLLAASIHVLWPEARFGVGPVTEDGFYYDVDLDVPLKEADLVLIQDKMLELQQKNMMFERTEWPIDQAIAYMEDHHQPYKVELLKLLKEKGSTSVNASEEKCASGIDVVSVYKLGQFIDLCKGPHVEATSDIGVFKLINIAGAYWRGDSKNPQLQRIYGLCFSSQKELDHRLWQKEEAKKRDHRHLGEQLEIFRFSEDIGQGLPLWLPNGAIIRQELEHLARHEENREGYLPVITPIIGKEKLYEKSGHLAHYHEDMYAPIQIEEEIYYLRPMNCPHHHQIYLARPRSYRELPLRIAEYGSVFRYEASGGLSGLMRTRGFCQNDAHIYCTYEQAKEEFLKVMQLHARYYDLLGIKDYHMRLSLPDLDGSDKYVNDPEEWNATIAIIRDAMNESGLPYEEVAGEAAFYGPKVDFMIKSVIGVSYAISTNQLDFMASKRFDLHYIGSDGLKHPVYVIHRAPLGSHERFVAFLLEHYAGNFPTWLAPIQVRIMPIADRHKDRAHEVLKMLQAFDIQSANGKIRVDIDDSDERMQRKIANAQCAKIPYMIILGDKEIESGKISIRRRDGQQISDIDVLSFGKILVEEIRGRSISFALV